MTDTFGQLISAKRYKEAVTMCKEALAFRPNDPRLLYLLAVAHYYAEDYVDAIRALRQTIDADPSNIDALLLMALLCSWGYGEGYTKAPELYHKVLALNGYEVDAYIGLALSRGSPGVSVTAQQSVELLEQALKIDPARPEIHNNLAYAYWEDANYEEAERHFRRLREVSDPVLRPAIQSHLRALKAREKPQDIAYLGPRVPRLP